MEKDNIEKKGNPSEVKEALESGTPHDVKESVKRIVEKGVSAVAGALKGVADSAERENVAGSAKNALHELGETTKELVKEGQKQIASLKGGAKQPRSPPTGSGFDTLGTPVSDAEATGLASLPPVSPSKDLESETTSTQGASPLGKIAKERERERGI